jgi:bifunctional diaminopimelate decarboxylase / aspartate kinase
VSEGMASLSSSSSLPWTVLKYGGTSVASAKNWGAILRRIQELLPSSRVWVVVSALSQVTNLLLRAVDDAVNPAIDAASRFAACDQVVSLHRKIASDMSLSADEQAPVELLLLDLRRLLDGIVLTQEVSPRLRARVAAFGELCSSQLGLAYLRKAGLVACRVDPRTLLTSEQDSSLSEADMYLEADVRPTTQVPRANAASEGCPVVICGGFIAATPSGATCLLGRGGSDTSAALFASFVGAQRLEIWTDVNGACSCDPSSTQLDSV